MARLIDKSKSKEDKMAISRKGITIMIVGVLVMIAGFILLSGGGSDDPEVFSWAMFDGRRLIAAPVVIIAGIAIEIIAIMKRL